MRICRAKCLEPGDKRHRKIKQGDVKGCIFQCIESGLTIFHNRNAVTGTFEN